MSTAKFTAFKSKECLDVLCMLHHGMHHLRRGYVCLKETLAIFVYYDRTTRAHGDAVGWGTALPVGRWRVLFLLVSWEFFIYFLRQHYGPGVDSVSNRNEYKGCSLGVKAVGS